MRQQFLERHSIGRRQKLEVLLCDSEFRPKLPTTNVQNNVGSHFLKNADNNKSRVNQNVGSDVVQFDSSMITLNTDSN